MQQSTENDKRIIRYLLGDLPEIERTAVEREYFADQGKVEEVWAAENDLIDSYAAGGLTGGERRLFERNYLQSLEHRDRVAVARRLRRAILAFEKTIKERRVANRIVELELSWQSRMTGWLKALRTPRFVQVAMACLLIFSVFSWLMIERTRLIKKNEEPGMAKNQLSEPQRREQEVTNQPAVERKQPGELKLELDRLRKPLARSASHPTSQINRQTILTFFLTPLLIPRAEGAPQQKIFIPGKTDLIRFKMRIENDKSRRVQAAIRTVEGAIAWNQQSLKPKAGFITVNVPARQLPLGDYILTLATTLVPAGETPIGEAPAGEALAEEKDIDCYFFRVIRK